jgi:hypothetical protein
MTADLAFEDSLTASGFWLLASGIFEKLLLKSYWLLATGFWLFVISVTGRFTFNAKLIASGRRFIFTRKLLAASS